MVCRNCHVRLNAGSACRRCAQQSPGARRGRGGRRNVVLSLMTLLVAASAVAAPMLFADTGAAEEGEEIRRTGPRRSGLGDFGSPGVGAQSLFGLSPTPTNTTGDVGKAIDSDDLASLQDLKTYRYTAKVEGFGTPLVEFFTGYTDDMKTQAPKPTQNTVMDISGAWVGPNRGVQTFKSGTGAVTYTDIANTRWVGVGNSAPTKFDFEHTPRHYSFADDVWNGGSAHFLGYSEDFDIRCLAAKETVNKVSTRKCTVYQPTQANLTSAFNSIPVGNGADEIKSFNSGAVVEVWLRDSDFMPIRMRMQLAGKDNANRDFKTNFSMDITDINSTAIKIDPPSGGGGGGGGGGRSTVFEGELGLVEDLDSYRWTAHFEGSGPLVNSFFTSWAENPIGAAKPSADKTAVMDLAGAAVGTNRGTLTAKMGNSEATSITINRNRWWLKDGSVTEQYELKDTNPGPEWYSYFFQIWDDQLWVSASTFFTLSCADSKETINKVSTHKCVIQDPNFDDYYDVLWVFSNVESDDDIDFFNGTVPLEVWLSVEDNLPIRIKANLTGKDASGKEFKMAVTADLLDVNSNAITINPPR